MLYRKLLVTLLLVCPFFQWNTANAQLPYDLSPPIGHTIRLSGSFGELRSNHFHAGIDIKSKAGSTGDSLFSIADGYVSRIMVHPSGYGNAITIDHSNGLTSMYAHLDRFEESLYQLIRRYQISEKSYIIDFNIAPNEFPVKKGQHIGYMGNTGYSFGPHLHFEIFRTESEMLINPLLFNYSVKDQTPPELQMIRAYGWDHKRRKVYGQNTNILIRDKRYYIKGDTLRIPADRASFAIATIDKTDGLHHKNGIYRLEMYVDDSLRYIYQMDSFPKSERRALNAHTDFEQYMKYGNWMHRLHRLPGNNVRVYPFIKNDGLILLKQGETSAIKVIVYDIDGNFSLITFHATRAEYTENFTPPKDQYFMLNYKEENLIQQEDIQIFFPVATLYEDLYFQLFEQKAPSWCVYSKYFKVHNNAAPLHHNIDIKIKPDPIPAELRDKAFLAHCVGTTTYNHGGKWEGDFFSGPTHQFGDFCIMIDTIPPSIKTSQFYSEVRKQREFRFVITDNFTKSRHVDDLTVEAFINNEWILGSYDTRTKVFVLPIQQVPPGSHTLTIKAKDTLGNLKVWEQSFVKHPL